MPRAPAKPYTLGEKRRILQYIIRHKAYHQVKGNALWIRMAASEFQGGHSWQSLKEHYKKQLLQSLTLSDFRLTEAEIANFRRGYGILLNAQGRDQTRSGLFYKSWVDQEPEEPPKAVGAAAPSDDGDGGQVFENVVHPNPSAPSQMPRAETADGDQSDQLRIEKEDDSLKDVAAADTSKEGIDGSQSVLEKTNGAQPVRLVKLRADKEDDTLKGDAAADTSNGGFDGSQCVLEKTNGDQPAPLVKLRTEQEDDSLKDAPADMPKGGIDENEKDSENKAPKQTPEPGADGAL